MNSQFKKGIIELVVLGLLWRNDLYGFQLVSAVPSEIGISEGTIYPLLKRLREEGYVGSYLQETTDGPPRKYYFLTSFGRDYYLQSRDGWIIFDNAVNSVIRRPL